LGLFPFTAGWSAVLVSSSPAVAGGLAAAVQPPPLPPPVKVSGVPKGVGRRRRGEGAAGEARGVLVVGTGLN
jgi:hypothetical protein